MFRLIGESIFTRMGKMRNTAMLDYCVPISATSYLVLGFYYSMLRSLKRFLFLSSRQSISKQSMLSSLSILRAGKMPIRITCERCRIRTVDMDPIQPSVVNVTCREYLHDVLSQSNTLPLNVASCHHNLLQHLTILNSV